jgi:hypothetical protein
MYRNRSYKAVCEYWGRFFSMQSESSFPNCVTCDINKEINLVARADQMHLFIYHICHSPLHKVFTYFQFLQLLMLCLSLVLIFIKLILVGGGTSEREGEIRGNLQLPVYELGYNTS